MVGPGTGTGTYTVCRQIHAYNALMTCLAHLPIGIQGACFERLVAYNLKGLAQMFE